jgi:Fic family protein
VADTAAAAVDTAHQLLALFELDAQAIRDLGRTAGNILRVFDVLRRRPVATVDYLAAASGVSYGTTVRAVRTLTETGLLRELTGRRRGRVFAYDRYLAILSDGAQPL